MTEFNPYNKWFGISKDEDSPNHYQILGLNPGEFDPDVIEAVAEQRMLFLESIRNEANNELADKLKREVKLAKLTLLDPQKRDAHDLELSVNDGMSTAGQPSSIEQTRSAANPPTVFTPPQFLLSPNTIDHSDPPQDNPGTQDNLLPRPSPSPRPAPLPKHLINSVIAQTPNSQTFGSPTAEVSPSSSSRNSPKEPLHPETEGIVVSSDKRINVASSRANRSETKRNQNKLFGQVAMLFVPTILFIILVTVFPNYFESLIHGIRSLRYGKDSVTSPK